MFKIVSVNIDADFDGEEDKPPLVITIRIGQDPKGAQQFLQSQYKAAQRQFPFNKGVGHTNAAAILDESALPGGDEDKPVELAFWAESVWQERQALRAKYLHNHYALRPDEETAIITPGTRRTIKTMRMVGVCAWLMAMVALSAVGFNIVTRINSPAWKTTPKQVADANAELAKTQASLNGYRRAAGLLTPQSSGLFVLQLTSRLFPENCGITVNSVEYAASFEPPEKKSFKEATTYNLQRLLTIKGEATAAGVKYLEKISDPDELRKLVAEIATQAGFDAYNPDTAGVSARAELAFRTAQGGINTFELKINLPVGAKSPVAFKVK